MRGLKKDDTPILKARAQYEAEGKLLGRQFKMTTTTILTCPEKVEEKGIDDNGTIIKAIYTLTEVRERLLKALLAYVA